ncbi:arabinogalactan endo-1,4-beta-galactosidase (plasmid) [Clostridium butyricum]|uniref:glycoside hydrolase family 53 protein n=1 Tax=Clostridium butyricum TaxID=1492 RepID=UPI000F52D9DC|nr:glycosyl hydrolase 53 family protein [Clostridium butyricum]RQN07596.1 arabinogalactan endo-1,4-beta-galactosidase [Clostridium butyricum]
MLIKNFRSIFSLALCVILMLTISLFPTKKVQAATSFAKGADVGWLSEMEYYKWNFYNDNGVKQDCLQILKDHGINSIRFRVWVNPSRGFCNKDDVVKQAVRAKNMGFRIMIDFHYSDTWCDPGQQAKPAAWANYDFNGLMDAVYNYTYDVMSTLKSNGVYPEWVQVGNETNNGMLWEEGRASTNMKNFAWLINCGYDAVKKVNSSSKVIVHLPGGDNNEVYRWLFDGLQANGAKYDVIGMSLYPTTTNWASLNKLCLDNMNDMVKRYGKEVMLCEVGMDVTQPLICKEFLTDIIKKTKSVTGGKGIGVFYWEPECYGDWNEYYKGAFDSTGKPTVALDAFL